MKLIVLNMPSRPSHAATVPMPSAPGAQQSAASVSDQTFVALLRAYRAAGGIARSEELRRRAEATRRDATRYVGDLPDPDGSVNFTWNDMQWWPLFQFDAEMSVRPEVARIAREFAAAIADWELARWFVTPNDWLGGEVPIDCVSSRSGATLQAARADRFIAVGMT